MTFENSKLMDLCLRLRQLYNGTLNPFPYRDYRRLLAKVGKTARYLVPDLDLHCSLIAGFCSRGPGLTKLTDDQIAEARRIAGKAFFEKHLKYQSLRPLITKASFPDLFGELNRIEEMRILLLQALDLIESSKCGSRKD
jgi:hypothetical protein